MYSIPPPTRFLVLSAAESRPHKPASSGNFLVLSPTESGPDPRAVEESQSETDDQSDLAPLSRARTNSSCLLYTSDAADEMD